MRVLLTTDTIGGVWTFTQSLINELLDKGHLISLISFGRPPSVSQQNWCTFKQRNHELTFTYVSSGVPLEWMDNNTHCYSHGLTIILEVAKRFQPDIIHTSQFCYGSLPLPIPVVVTAHSDVLSWAAACQPDGLPDSPWLMRYKSLVQEGLNDASTVVAPTHWMLKALQRSFAVTAATQTILNGRTLTALRPTGDRKLQAVSVGRLWDEAKNLRLLATIRSPMPVLVAGEQLHGSAAANVEPGTLTILGHLDEPELLSLFAQSSIYIVPSIYEPFGLAPLEAALCGCAVVAYDMPSLREVWGNAALYFNDAATLEQMLIDLCASAQRLAKAQYRSLERAQQLTSKRMGDQYIALYNSLIYSQEPGIGQEEPTHVC